jgi:hypothetical protein
VNEEKMIEMNWTRNKLDMKWKDIRIQRNDERETVTHTRREAGRKGEGGRGGKEEREEGARPRGGLKPHTQGQRSRAGCEGTQRM